MTRQEKLKEIDQLLEELEKEEEEEITEKKTEKTIDIPEYAIVLNLDNGKYCLKINTDHANPVASYILACTIGARIPNAIWATVDRDGIMQWYEDEPYCSISGRWYSEKGPRHFEGKTYRVHCPLDDWKSAKWKIR